MPDLNAINESGVGYVVILTNCRGRYLAYGSHGSPAVFEKRAAALDFRDQLWKVHGCGKGKVVKVTYRIEDLVKEG